MLQAIDILRKYQWMRPFKDANQCGTKTDVVKKFRSILNEITITGNGILLKGERIILPASLQSQAVELAHRRAHPGRSGLAWRLRYHFYFYGMQKMIEDYVLTCQPCNLYVDKKTVEPIQHHAVPDNNWDTTSRQTPHPATGLPPASVLFKDGYRGDFPRQKVSEEQVLKAKQQDEQQKMVKDARVNS